nr:ChaN family lipoprotein [Salinivibrio sp. IB282]
MKQGRVSVRLINTLLAAACIAFTSSALHAKTDALATLFDYQVTRANGEPLRLTQVTAQVADADVVLIGEWHGHPGVHRFQTELLSQLASEHSVALSMEQFSRDAQPVLNQYLAGEIGEDTLKRQANAWDNYDGSYRPPISASLRPICTMAAPAKQTRNMPLSLPGMPPWPKASSRIMTLTPTAKLCMSPGVFTWLRGWEPPHKFTPATLNCALH